MDEKKEKKKENSLVEKAVKRVVITLSGRMIKTIADELLDVIEEKIPKLEKAARASVENPVDDILVDLLKTVVAEIRKIL